MTTIAPRSLRANGRRAALRAPRDASRTFAVEARRDVAGPRIAMLECAQAHDAALAQCLRDTGFDVLAVSRPREIAHAALASGAALVLLHLAGGGRALPLCRAIKATANVPVLVLAERSHGPQCAHALETGADDYLAQPVGAREVAARVKAILRRTYAPARAACERGLALDGERYAAVLDGQPLALTPAEFRLLAALDGGRHRVVARADLARAAGSERDASTRALDSLVRNLRRKLDAVRPGGKTIRATYGVGYRLHL